MICFMLNTENDILFYIKTEDVKDVDFDFLLPPCSVSKVPKSLHNSHCLLGLAKNGMIFIIQPSID